MTKNANAEVKCPTHHHACACREAQVAELVDAAARIIACEFGIGSRDDRKRLRDAVEALRGPAQPVAPAKDDGASLAGRVNAIIAAALGVDEDRVVLTARLCDLTANYHRVGVLAERLENELGIAHPQSWPFPEGSWVAVADVHAYVEAHAPAQARGSRRQSSDNPHRQPCGHPYGSDTCPRCSP